MAAVLLAFGDQALVVQHCDTFFGPDVEALWDLRLHKRWQSADVPYCVNHDGSAAELQACHIWTMEWQNSTLNVCNTKKSTA